MTRSKSAGGDRASGGLGSKAPPGSSPRSPGRLEGNKKGALPPPRRATSAPPLGPRAGPLAAGLASEGHEAPLSSCAAGARAVLSPPPQTRPKPQSAAKTPSSAGRRRQPPATPPPVFATPSALPRPVSARASGGVTCAPASQDRARALISAPASGPSLAALPSLTTGRRPTLAPLGSLPAVFPSPGPRAALFRSPTSETPCGGGDGDGGDGGGRGGGLGARRRGGDRSVERRRAGPLNLGVGGGRGGFASDTGDSGARTGGNGRE